MRIKYSMCCVLILVLLMTSFALADEMTSSVMVYYSVNDIQIDGASSMPTQKPFILDGTTYVPLRYISEAFGYEVSWDGATQSIDIMTTMMKDMDSMDDSMDSMNDNMDTMDDMMMSDMVTVYYNVMDIKIDHVSSMPTQKPFILDGTTYVPLRYISEAFGYDVAWEADTHVIMIDTVHMDSMNSMDDADMMGKTFNVEAYQFGFEPGTIEVNKGDTVHLNLTSRDVEHVFYLPEYEISLKVDAGETESVTFVADQAGTFEFRCNVYCGSGHSTMTGTLIVKE